MKEKIKIRGLLALVTLATLSHLSSAHAEQAESAVNVYAGLGPVMTLTCTPVNFGVYQVARGNRGIGVDPTQVTMTTSVNPTNGQLRSNISFSNAGQDQIALSDKSEYAAPSAGVCEVKGSRIRNGTLYITRDPVAFSPLLFGATTANTFAPGLKSPISALSGMNAYLTIPTTLTTDAEGEGSFSVIGDVLIPNNLTADNYGAYKAAVVTVTVSETP